MTTALVDSAPVSRQSQPSRPSLDGPTDAAPPKGWRPANNDHTLPAVAWRVQRTQRKVREHDKTLKELKPVVQELTATLKASDDAWAARWSTLSKVAWGVGIPVLVAATLGGLALLGRFLSTFHR